MMEIPVFLFTGFLESGKSTFILNTLRNPEFSTGEKTILITCEEGIEEYDKKELEKYNTYVIEVEDEEAFTADFLKSCQAQYKPKRVLIEYNGMWQLDTLRNMVLPRKWILAQILTTVDAGSYDMYLNNMRSLMIDKFKDSDLIVFNRCTKDSKKGSYRRAVLAVNKQAQIIYEMEDGTIADLDDEDMPFDINAPVIDVEDDDFGLWYLDAMDKPEKYKGKKVHIKGMAFRPSSLPKNAYVIGRKAMTCCADDITFIGFICKEERPVEVKRNQWFEITAEVAIEYMEDYQGKGPVLYIEERADSMVPEDELVYFN